MNVDLEQRPSGIYIPRPPQRHYDRPVAIDLFAGAGGFSLGCHQAGFHVVAALEFDPWAAITYTVNLGAKGIRFHFDTPEREADFTKKVEQHLGMRKSNAKTPAGLMSASGLTAGDGWISHYGCLGCATCEGIGFDGNFHEFLAEVNKAPVHGDGCEHFWVADARNITGAEILDAIGLERGDVDLVFGGPPCQGFSIAGRRNVVDPRNSLVFEFARLVLEINPKAFAMENVPGMLSMTTPEGLPVVDALCRVMEDGDFGGYEALRSSLLSTAGVGAAVKGKPRSKKDKQRAEARAKKAADVDAQGTLL